MRREVNYGSLLTFGFTKKSHDKYRNNNPDDTPEEYYKPVITIPSLDHLLEEFLKRLTSLQQRATTTFVLFPPVDIALNDETVNFIREDLPSGVNRVLEE